MTSAHYRGLAAQCEAKARQETDPKIRNEWDHMARAYRRLAQQADRNALTDVTYETPLEKTSQKAVQETIQERPATTPVRQLQQQQQQQASGERQNARRD